MQFEQVPPNTSLPDLLALFAVKLHFFTFKRFLSDATFKNPYIAPPLLAVFLLKAQLVIFAE